MQSDVCGACGHVLSNNQSDYDSKTAKNVMVYLLFFAIVVVTVFFQVRNWDRHAISVIPLQIKAAIGALNVQDLEERAAMCLERRYYDCTEEDYTGVANATRDPKMILRLGKFQISREKYADAARTFQAYFQVGGNDMSAQISYAKALGQIGNIDEASNWYERILAAKPDVVQVTVIQNYVKLLLAANKTERAKELVAFVQENANSGFMSEVLSDNRAPASAQ
jgi:tetratricopeptide (TPR) repeat protein